MTALLLCLRSLAVDEVSQVAHLATSTNLYQHEEFGQACLLLNKNHIDTLPQDALSLFDNLCEKDKPLIWIASISKDGKPHIVPTCFVRPAGGNKIVIGGVFIKQTVKNLKQNSQIAMGSARFVEGYDGYMVKGTSQVIESGSE